MDRGERHDALRRTTTSSMRNMPPLRTIPETEIRLEELGNELDALNDRPYVFDPDEVASRWRLPYRWPPMVS